MAHRSAPFILFIIFVFIIENVVILCTVTVGTHNKSYHCIHTYHSRSACTEEWKRYADNRRYFKHHSDIHKAVCKYKPECTDAYEFAQMVTGDPAVSEYFKADVGKHDYYAKCAHKTEDLSGIGENKVVVYLGNGDIIVRLSKKSLAENSARFEGSKS